MELKELQAKYPEFIYKGYSWKIQNGGLTADFSFLLGDIEFSPRVVVAGVSQSAVDRLGEAAVSNLVFNIGMAEIPSYWKAACSPRIVIEAGYLDKKQAAFWQDLIFNMGQFFYENNLPFIRPDFKIVSQKPLCVPRINLKMSSRCLVPLGGGKDSLVTLEIIRQSGRPALTYTVNANTALEAVITAVAVKNVFIERYIDKKLVAIKDQGFLNGHTPVSAVFSVCGAAVAALFDCGYLAISQERSSDEGNVRYLGHNVNHQYSKSLVFEKKFRAYCRNYLVKNLNYFSFLRPLYEMQIAALFSRYPQYFPCFVSCNKGFTIKNRQAKTNSGWCGKCSKCLSTFVLLYPVLGREQMVKIFGKNLFEDHSLAPIMVDLLGEGMAKPFECVSTFNEMRAAFYLAQAMEGKSALDLPLLAEFRKNYLSKYKNINRLASKIFASWSNRHCLPLSLAALLKKSRVKTSFCQNRA